MRAAVIVFPGSNCDRDLKVAFQNAGANVEMIWHKETQIPKGVDVIGIPGGLSFGDYLRCGAIAANSPICRSMLTFAESGGYVLGICNGFQILVEAGLLPGALLRNASLKFVCRDVGLRVENNRTLFARDYDVGQTIRIPVAHHDGNYFADDATLDRLEDEARVAFRYVALNGEGVDRYNPNGSIRHIAGIYNETKTVLGMMPHPENAIRANQGSTDGWGLFASMAAAFR